MYEMMNTNGLGYGIFTGWALHWAFGTLWIIGAILFVAWAIKNLHASTLRNWSIGFFVAGVLGTIITAPADMAIWRTMFGNRNAMMMNADGMGRMMQEMMEHDRGEGDEEHGDMMQMMRMMMGSPQGGMMTDDEDFPSGTLRDEHHESSASSL